MEGKDVELKYLNAVVSCCKAEVISRRGRRGAEIAELDGGEGCRVELVIGGCKAEVILRRGRRGAEIAELDGGERCRVEVFKCRCKLL